MLLSKVLVSPGLIMIRKLKYSLLKVRLRLWVNINMTDTDSDRPY